MEHYNINNFTMKQTPKPPKILLLIIPISSAWCDNNLIFVNFSTEPKHQ